MDFTELYKQSSLSCCFSPNAIYLASIVQSRVVIRDADTLQIVHLFSCQDTIHHIEWSIDSDFILAACYALGRVYVWALAEENWVATVDEGAVGLIGARWSPDARHILTFTDFQLRLTIWSLLDKSTNYIQYPKYSDKGVEFRRDGKYMAILERKDSKEKLGIYNCEDWSLIKQFPLETDDAQLVSWSPDGRFFAIPDSMLQYKVFIYSPDGRCLKKYVAFEVGLGIKTIQWSPSSQFLAIGSYDSKVRLLNSYTWNVLFQFGHPAFIKDVDVAVFKELESLEFRGEVEDPNDSNMKQTIRPRIKYILGEHPFNVGIVKPDPTKPNPKVGVGWLEFNCDGTLCFTRNDNMPNSLWIWDVTKLSQVCLIQQSSFIRCAKWNPTIKDRLVLLTGNGVVYMWNEGNEQGGICESVEVPSVSLNLIDFNWSPDGRSLVLMDKDKFCIAFPVDDIM